ncbi:hypothetical protein BB558_002187 [Smittium angustum]|uniref:Uncharacterized protein n=1 Tax=Smittium angustum TaxID=133377 RepID=A0A2U1J9E6_SMIAN|nr:hypothetical protein BB558_002187 [Smittium angustum]
MKFVPPVAPESTNKRLLCFPSHKKLASWGLSRPCEGHFLQKFHSPLGIAVNSIYSNLHAATIFFLPCFALSSCEKRSSSPRNSKKKYQPNFSLLSSPSYYSPGITSVLKCHTRKAVISPSIGDYAHSRKARAYNSFNTRFPKQKL